MTERLSLSLTFLIIKVTYTHDKSSVTSNLYQVESKNPQQFHFPF